LATFVLSLHAQTELVLSHPKTPVLHGAPGFVLHAAPTAHCTQAPLVLQKPPVHAVFAVVRAQPAVSLSCRMLEPQLPVVHVRSVHVREREPLVVHSVE
jgi:hypothetical protein